MWHAWKRREKCTRLWWESPNEMDHLEDQGVNWRMGTDWILRSLAFKGRGVGCRVDSVGSG
jgi:hypothetical protein